MTTEELYVFLMETFCGCGAPGEAAEFLMKALEWLENKSEKYRAGQTFEESKAEFVALMQTDGARYFMFYVLCSLDLEEHGGSVPGWTTGKGSRVLAALKREHAADGFASLLDTQRCIHGFDVENFGTHKCE